MQFQQIELETLVSAAEESQKKLYIFGNLVEQIFIVLNVGKTNNNDEYYSTFKMHKCDYLWLTNYGCIAKQCAARTHMLISHQQETPLLAFMQNCRSGPVGGDGGLEYIAGFHTNNSCEAASDLNRILFENK